MSMHKPVDSIRWQASQKLSLLAWEKKNLTMEREQLERSLLPILLRYAREYPEDATVLEIGCGPICLTRMLPQPDKTYLDPMADDFRRMFPGELPEEGEYITSAAERIRKPAGSFDLIVCLNMISHTLNPELVMNEIERLLKPGGTLILSIRTHSQLEARLHYLAIRMFPRLCSKTRPYYYARKGIRRTLQRHFNIKDEIVQKAHAIRLPFCKRQRHVFVCTPQDSATPASS